MNFINKINKYLLEHYPLIWNTRLVWMLAINILIHLFFFLIGFFSANNMSDLKDQINLSAFFFETSNVYYNFLISIFIILIWIIFYLRNNAFKNLYNVKKHMLFQQFCIIFCIIFISSTQFYSFKKGLTIRVKSLYDWEETDKDIKTFNKASLFLMQNQDKYEISNKKYPAPFPLQIASSYYPSQADNIDTTKAYLQYGNRYLQFYKIDEKLWEKEKKKEINNGFNFEFSKNDFKYRIVKDISEFKELIYPSLYNYSDTKFSFGQDSLDYQNQLNYCEEILDNKDNFEIQKELEKFLELSKKYNAQHNLTVDTWFKLIDNKPNYLLTKLIGKTNPQDDDLNQLKYNYDNKKDMFESNIPFSKTYYFSYNNTDHFFGNVYEAYFPKTDVTFFNILFTFCFILAIIIFIFKTTSLKNILLSFVASLVVLVLIVWLMSSSKTLLTNSISRENIIMIFISLVIILLSITSYILKWKKIVVSIFWSLVLFAVPAFFLFSSLYYSRYLKELHASKFPKELNYISNFEIWFGTYGFWAIMFIWLFTVFTYSLYIRKLRARVE